MSRSPTSFLRSEDALDLPNVIEVVTGEHPHDVLHRFDATLGMDSMVLPLKRSSQDAAEATSLPNVGSTSIASK